MKEDEIRSCQQRAGELKRTIDNLNREISDIQQAKVEKIGNIEKVRQDIGAFERQIRDCQVYIQQAESAKQNRLNAFQRQVPNILRKVDQLFREGAFRGSKPKGPLGMSVQVTDPKFAQVIESVLDKVVNGFVVDHLDDVKTMNRIMKEVGAYALAFYTRTNTHL